MAKRRGRVGLRQMREAAGLPAGSVSAKRLHKTNPRLARRFAGFIRKNRKQIISEVAFNLRSSGAQTYGGGSGSVVKVRAHIRKGKPVRQSTRHLGTRARDLLASYRNLSAAIGGAQRGRKLARSHVRRKIKSIRRMFPRDIFRAGDQFAPRRRK